MGPVKQLAIGKEINSQVFVLYGLTDDEITVIENQVDENAEQKTPN